MRRLINAVAILLCAVLFVLPILGMAYHAHSLREAEKQHEAAMAHHQREIQRIVRDSHVRSR